MNQKDKFPKRGGKPSGKPAGKPASAKDAPKAQADERAPERIAKILARAGVASRRDAERMILDGRVKVNGKVLESPAVNVTLADKIEVDGEEIRGIERTRLWIYHKPAGLVTTNADPEGRTTVFEKLPKDLPRVISIGRLDINTEGLLLLTNDGGLARVLELPATGWLRRYRVRAHGRITQDDLDKLKDGIAVDGVLYGAIDATLDREQGSNVWITMGLREGKNREIKNVLGALGLEVSRLIRISYGPFQLGELAEGNVLEVRGRTLRDQLGPRLIEESGANFDAPIYHDGEAAVPKPAEAEAPKRGPRREKLDRQERAERGRDRLDTKRRGEEKPVRDVERNTRSANVWMAAGARPLGPKAKKKAEDKAREDARRDARKDSRRRGEGDSPRAARPAGSRPARGGGKPQGGKPGGGFVKGPRKPRAEGDAAAGGEKRFSGPKRPAGEGRPPRGEGRPAGGRPSGDKRAARPDNGKRGKPEGNNRPRGGAGGKGPRGNADRRR
ncbi:pseudouridine synthase [Martelella lutilitoris]|uniref:pseudouridine synthase n=1 Tax=Martelella lutilitoris TaxID=2583532 RepID=UPI001FF05753|nr:pseudouridine synthase [Martelella lutilitoris]